MLSPGGAATGLYEYILTGGGLALGESVTIHFTAGSWTYNGAASVTMPSQTLTIAAGQSLSYIDVTYPLINGSPIIAATVGPGNFTLGGSGASGVAIQANPLLVASGTTSETFRFFYTGSFQTGPVTISFIAGSWSDKAGDTSSASSQSFQVISQLAPPAAGQTTQQVFFIKISGELLLNDAGLTAGPLVDITGSVMLTIAAGPVFTLDASGTVFVYKLGNIASGAAHFVLNSGAGLALPELYGVLKLDTNFGFLKPYGITAQATAVLELNTTSSIQTVQIALQGLPGDLLFTDPSTGDVSQLPQSLGGSGAFTTSNASSLYLLFTQNGITLDDSTTVKSDPAPTVTAESDPVTGNLMWIVTSVLNGVTSRYYIRDIPADSSTNTSAHLEIDTELQTFNLRPETFLLQVSGELTIAPATTDSNPNPTPYFSIRGAVQIQISSSGFTFFAFAKLELTGGALAKYILLEVDPVLAALNFVDVTALFDIEFQNPDPAHNPDWIPGIAGYLKVNLSLGTGNLSSGVNGVSPNINFTGSFQLLFNTTLGGLMFTIPNQFLNLLDPTDPAQILIPAGPPQASLFSKTESNSSFSDASSLPQRIASPVALPSNWVGFFNTYFHQNSLPNLGSSPTVQLYSLDAGGNPYSWQVTDGSNIYYITKSFAVALDPTSTNQLQVVKNGGSPAVYIQLQIVGSLNLFNQITLSGSFTLTAAAGGSATSLSLQGIVTANVAFLGTLQGTINFTIQVGYGQGAATGMWGSATLSLQAGGIIPGVSLNASVELLLNASNQAQTLQGFVKTGTNPDGSGIYALQNLTFQPGIEIQINGDLNIANLVTLQGEFDLTLQLAGPNPGLTITADAELMLSPFGNLAVSGVLAVNSQGLVAALSISLNVGFGGSLGISFSGSATLDLNTGSTAQTYVVGGQNLTVQPGFLLSINGSVSFIGLVTATGSATISITNQQFVISFNLSLSLAGSINLTASGFAGIYNDGHAGLVLELNTSIDATVASIISIKASGTLLLNTTNIQRSANGFTLGAGSFSLVLNGSVSILEVLKFNASFTILVGGNQQDPIAP